MSGIYGCIVKGNTTNKIHDFFSNHGYENSISQEIILDNVVLGRCVLNKFEKDRFLYQNENYIVCFEGINYSNQIFNSPIELIEVFKKEGVNFVKNLKGVFVGFIYDIQNQKLYIYNDHLASKSIYFFYSADKGLIFASELKVVSKLMNELNIEKKIEKDGIYLLALYGHLLDDLTVIKGVKRLKYATVMCYDLKNQSLKSYNWYKYKKSEIKISMNDAIDKIDVLMTKAIEREWNKDKEYGLNHITLLSGGMDAKTNALIAKESGYDDVTSLTFGQSNSSDIRIAEKIASENNFSHISKLLDNGLYLTKDIYNDYIALNDGLIMFQGSAHMSYTLGLFDFKKFGVLHSGQIGDVLFGSFVKPRFDLKKNKKNLGYTGFIKNDKLLDKIECLDGILSNYEGTNNELYSYEQRQINGTLMGDRSISNIVDHVSPFYDRDLIEFCLSLPERFKINQRIYFEWLNSNHSYVTKYEWDKIGASPSSTRKIYCFRLWKKYFNGGKKYFGLNYDSMTPFSKWLRNNTSILRSIEKIFNEEIVKVQDIELRSDLTEIYNSDVFEYRNKFAVVTTLLALRLHFDL